MRNLLLILGGLLLTVAAVVFTVVSWGRLGIGGRTAVLAAFTALALAVPALLVRRRLTATAETVAAFAVALLILDGYAARQVGLLGVNAIESTDYIALSCAIIAIILAVYAWFVPLRGPAPVAVVLLQPVLLLLSEGEVWPVTAMVVTAALDVALVWAIHSGLTVAKAGSRGVAVTATVCGAGVATLALPAGTLYAFDEVRTVPDALTRSIPLVGLALLGGIVTAQLARSGSRVGAGFAAAGTALTLIAILSACLRPALWSLGPDWPLPGYTFAALAVALAATQLPWAGVRQAAVATSGTVALLTVVPVLPQIIVTLAGPLTWFDTLATGTWGTGELSLGPIAVTPQITLLLALLAAGAWLIPWSTRRGSGDTPAGGRGTGDTPVVPGGDGGTGASVVPGGDGGTGASVVPGGDGGTGASVAPGGGGGTSVPGASASAVTTDVHRVSPSPIRDGGHSWRRNGGTWQGRARRPYGDRNPANRSDHRTRSRGAGVPVAMMVASVVFGAVAVAVAPVAFGLAYPAAVAVEVALTAGCAALAVRARRPGMAAAFAVITAAVSVEAAAYGFGTRPATLTVLPILAGIGVAIAYFAKVTAIRGWGLGAAMLFLGLEAMTIGLAVGWSIRISASLGFAVVGVLAVALAAWIARRAAAQSLAEQPERPAEPSERPAEQPESPAERPEAAGARKRDLARRLGYTGTALLLVATWLRLWAGEITVVEAYTVPLSAVLLGIGWWRSRGTEVSSWTAYGVGLSSTMGPSLVAVYADDEWVRSLVLGLVALALLLAGAKARLQAPTVIGGLTLAGVALRELAPIVSELVLAIPRWVPIALGGLLLVLIGATYEARMRDLRKLRDIITRMR